MPGVVERQRHQQLDGRRAGDLGTQDGSGISEATSVLAYSGGTASLRARRFAQGNKALLLRYVFAGDANINGTVDLTTSHSSPPLQQDRRRAVARRRFNYDNKRRPHRLHVPRIKL